MNYTDTQKKTIRQARSDAFASGYRKGCCWSIFTCSFFIVALSFCSNKPIDNQMMIDKKPNLLKKGNNVIQPQKESHTR